MISKNTLHLLEYDRLLRIISEAAHSDVTKQMVLDISPMASLDDIRDRFVLVEDMRKVIRLSGGLPFQSFADITDYLDFVRPAGAVLDASDISAFIPVLLMAGEIGRRIADASGLDSLPAIASSLSGQPDILELIERSIGPEGSILDSASPELSRIRRELRRLDRAVLKRLEELTRDESVSVFLQDDFITRRSGRPVIPVRMDSKGMVPGVVHDVSKSGDTAFIEPLGIIHLSNELENLAAEEKAEELRILRSISERIRERADLISGEFNAIVTLDLLNCIAVFADSLRCETPAVSNGMNVKLLRARHPLLEMSFSKSGVRNRIVPLDLELGSGNSTMVITGSNAGGKTIAIKTVGLLVCMALSGIPVPADQSSEIPLAGSVLVDIGDEQSIESSLSTFSAHVTNMASILAASDVGTIVLIDELGTGTDPDEGAALACTILKELQSRGALVFATTHLVGIKGYVHRETGMLNASMEFDRKTLTPLYRLRTGEPGQSHALDVALRYGMPENVIRSARELLDRSSAEFEELMADLNMKRADYEKRLDDLALRESDIRKRTEDLDVMIHDAEARSMDILADAQREAASVLSDIKRRMHAELDRLKALDKQELKNRVREIEQMQKAAAEKLSSIERSEKTVELRDLKPGDTVYVRSLGCNCMVAEVTGKSGKVKVSAKGKDILVPVSELAIAKSSEAGKEAVAVSINAADAAPSRIKFIGMRVDEAISMLEPFLNHASLDGYQEVTVIHGLGTGALKRGVREHISGHPLVSGFRDGEPSEGGAGVTVVRLR